MQRPSPLTWLPLWERALEVEIGIGFVVEGVERDYFRNTLYKPVSNQVIPGYLS
jgi:hypothetical protein